MKARELIEKIKGGALEKYRVIYSDMALETERYVRAIEEFCALYGDERDIHLFSVSGRSEILGNHTDHNRGCVLAGAVDRDIIAVAAKSEGKISRIKSEGYDECVVDIDLVDDKDACPDFSSAALISGLFAGLKMRGSRIGSFDAYLTTRVLKGSGLSSSAAFEVMIGNILNHLYNNGEIPNEEIAKISQFAENEYFGKPCGLMDQMACAVGGFVHIDFADPKNPIIEPINFSLADEGYSLCIVNTGGNHANLNEDYASVPYEMKSVAAYFGRDVLRGITEADIIANLSVMREAVGDRAALRAMHFVRENERVGVTASALRRKDIKGFFDGVMASGDSSFKYLQNVYTTQNVSEQGLSLALCVTDALLSGKGCAWRVHGGGFAGTIQAFVKNEYVSEYSDIMNSIFGKDACMILNIRPFGAIQIEL